MTFSIGGFDEDYAHVGEAWRTSGTSLDQVVGLPLAALGACARNTSATTMFVAVRTPTGLTDGNLRWGSAQGTLARSLEPCLCVS